jgi:hypothetical protein
MALSEDRVIGYSTPDFDGPPSFSHEKCNFEVSRYPPFSESPSYDLCYISLLLCENIENYTIHIPIISPLSF